MVMQHQKLEGHAERLVCQLQGQGNSEGLYNQNMTVFTVSSEQLTFLQPTVA